MGEEWPSLPLDVSDLWARRCGVQEIINRLIMDLVTAHPEDVMGFIHEWSAHRRTGGPTHTGPCSVDNAQREEAVSSERKLSHSSEELARFEEPNSCVDDENKDADAKLFRATEPTVQELSSTYPDARGSPFTPLVSEEKLEAFFRRSYPRSLGKNSLGVCLGRGNYGFVIPAIVKSEVKEETGQKGENEYPSDTNALSGVGNGRLVAIKVSRIQAIWSLDEAESLRRVTVCRKSLEDEVQMLQKEVDTLRDAQANDALQPQQEEQQAAHPGCNVSMSLLESRLHARSFLLQGARLVTSLVGDIMYDVERDAFWFPLEYYPSSLRECIQARSKLCTGSPPSGFSFPDISLNELGETAMALLFSVQEIQHVARSLCSALQFLNTSCSLCHLDVKVDNILLSSPWIPSGPELEKANSPPAGKLSGAPSNTTMPTLPQVVLGDLGLAQPLDTPIMQLGDFSTMAPEVYWASDCGNTNYTAYRTPVFCASSDMWSVGCVLLQMINGLEYNSWGPSDMFAALEENYVSPALRHPEVWPMELNDFIARCFERDPRRRMQAGDALRHPFLLFR
ncbi:protein kinase, putative [Trypanosoma cruzi marinkellei]|uniref:non-specific serine/threonine protein kinase n=1 Tax=Trypanosoma cruzi marinkellei TaxID=85056 RepID=K2M7Y0_TRYCR|nr:protein kinase, putative [Trypanosoma cruzi marinkellei]